MRDTGRAAGRKGAFDSSHHLSQFKITLTHDMRFLNAFISALVVPNTIYEVSFPKFRLDAELHLLRAVPQ